MTSMSPEAMVALASTVRRLRGLLESDLQQQLERRFRLAVPSERAELTAALRAQRARFEAWLAERQQRRPDESALGSALTEAASRVLVRLFLLRQLEVCGVSRPVLLGGGERSKGYLEFRGHAPALTDGALADELEGLDLLLSLVFDELAIELPGLYAREAIDELFVLSAPALREVLAALNAPVLESAWSDGTTLGWVYQFWNDPDREALDAKVGPRGKIAPAKIATKTQLFSERYMVEWLVHNSVGRLGLAMQAARRGAREVSPPWPMYVRAAAQPEHDSLPSRLEELKILDPACGSGHFLAGAFDALVPLYREQAHDLGEAIDDAQIAERVLRHNLHGVDIDGRAVQIAAAVLYLKARRLSRRGRIPPMNLLATPIERDGFRGSLVRFSAGASVPNLEPEPARTDLGVRFDGEPLEGGLRLQSLLTDGRYDVVLFNPPYLATAKIELPEPQAREAFGGHGDLFAAFVERALELCKPRGLIAFVALSNWMFLSSFRATRERLLEGQLLLLADVGKGAFRHASKLIQSAMVIASPSAQPGALGLAVRVGSRDAIRNDQTAQIAAALQDAERYRSFDPTVFAQVEGSPLLFWLPPEFLRRYAELPKIGEIAEGKGGIATTDNERFLRAVWELPRDDAHTAASARGSASHVPYVKGAEGREWIEPLRWLLRCEQGALELQLRAPSARPIRPQTLGVAYTTIGHRFSARLHAVASVRDVSGTSMFAHEPLSAAQLVCALNRSPVRELASAFNPTVNFQLNDVRRLPFDAVPDAEQIIEHLRTAFDEHERACELSSAFERPGPSRWDAAQRWAQQAVDRAPGEPLPPFELESMVPEPWQHLSYALGCALGRLGHEGCAVLPDRTLYLGVTTSSLTHDACAPLLGEWQQHWGGSEEALAEYLRKGFFAEHRRHYEGRPIYWPLSSARRSFVAYVGFHSLQPTTLSSLLAEHLTVERRNLEGRLSDLRRARQTGDTSGAVERRFVETQKLLEELVDFITQVTALAERGPPPADGKTKARESDARYAPHLDDGVLVNAALLWPLLEAQWKEPKKLWKELANAEGKKDCDWPRAIGRYFPTRVRARCLRDPSLAAAHRCLWELHPAVAYAWELRASAESGERVVIEEPLAERARAAFLAGRADQAAALEVKEQKRQARRYSSSSK